LAAYAAVAAEIPTAVKAATTWIFMGVSARVSCPSRKFDQAKA
jgi:hypothetical protein